MGAEPNLLPRWQRAVLPGTALGPGAKRSARDWIADLVMFGFALIVGSVALGSSWRQHSTGSVILDIVAGVIACGALWRRRERPGAVAGLAVSLSCFSALAGGAGIVALFNSAIRSPRRALLWIVAASVASAFTFPALYAQPHHNAYLVQAILGILFTGIALGWGLLARAQRDLVRSLHDRAERLEAEQRLEAERVREAERRRIAREMHDVLAHRISLLALHAGGLAFRRDAAPAEVSAAAEVIRGAAHSALEELRAVIGVLRDDEPPEGPEPPQPTLDAIPALVDESRTAGMHVDCRVEPPPGPVSPALGRTAYRVVQEGLTNARKHAPGAHVEVAVAPAGPAELRVSVRTRGPVNGAVTAGGGLPGSGAGLVGLRERVALAQGSLAHGLDADGDFVLTATLPVAR